MAEVKLFSRFLVVFCLLMFTCFCQAGRSRFSDSHNVEVQKHLNRLNKPAVKSIKSPDGDIIDCVHILDQPAFDHPLLKNHTIQMKPTSYQDENMKVSATMNPTNGSSLPVIPQLWHLNGKCPKGTIPIRRTTKEDLLRPSSLQSFAGKILRPKVDPGSQGHEYAAAGIEGKFYGTKATFNVWNPKVQKSTEFSLAQTWISTGSYDTVVESIEVGWHVNPNLTDYNTRLFIYWTADSYQLTGCHNLRCPGFVQVNNEIGLGTTIYGISQFEGPQYEMTVNVWKDLVYGNWWLQINGHTLGYWPANLFSQLSGSATSIEWGGEVVNDAKYGQHTTTQMGSGQYAEQGYRKASYIRNIQLVNQYNNLVNPKGKIYTTQQPGPRCYDLKLAANDVWGIYFYYGGPGRNPYCP